MIVLLKNAGVVKNNITSTQRRWENERLCVCIASSVYDAWSNTWIGDYIDDNGEIRMKAVLVIDMPVSCADCPCNNREVYCEITGWGILRRLSPQCSLKDNGLPEFCPLKPMPNDYPPYEKISNQNFYTEEEFDAYEKGWNDCIEELENG